MTSIYVDADGEPVSGGKRQKREDSDPERDFVDIDFDLMTSEKRRLEFQPFYLICTPHWFHSCRKKREALVIGPSAVQRPEIEITSAPPSLLALPEEQSSTISSSLEESSSSPSLQGSLATVTVTRTVTVTESLHEKCQREISELSSTLSSSSTTTKIFES